jgi:UDP-N-acetylmuramoyl-L-alanyl-D-glutamate--2,6-diaminopimelate ligase
MACEVPRWASAEPVLRTLPSMSASMGASSEGRPPSSRRLADLLRAVSGDVRPGNTDETLVTGIVSRAEDVEPGALFVALPGVSADGHAFIADAARRGAAAILVERDVGGALDVPMVRVSNARRALAELAAEWHGHPADGMLLIGITGTAGKTSTLSLLETILVAGGVRAGSIGSLGLHIQGETRDQTVYTTPDPLVLHGELTRLAAAGCDIVAMEATSHALSQDRVHGLQYRLGIFTNLLPLEHSEYHDTFQDYVEAKSLFFDMLAPDAPLVYNRDDPVTRELVQGRSAHGIGVGTGAGSDVRITPADTTAAGTRLTLRWESELPRRDGGRIGPATMDLRLRLLGPANRMNAALAATAALWAGVDRQTVAGALADFLPPQRRLEVVHKGRFIVLDDTVGHPESISAFFDVVETLAPRRCHLVYAVRGHRGERINRANGEALAIWGDRIGVETLIVTRSAEAADDLNRVEEQEYHAFLAPLREQGLPFQEMDRLEPAVHAVLEQAGDGDLVALLGAQGMDGAQDIARAWLNARQEISD